CRGQFDSATLPPDLIPGQPAVQPAPAQQVAMPCLCIKECPSLPPSVIRHFLFLRSTSAIFHNSTAPPASGKPRLFRVPVASHFPSGERATTWTCGTFSVASLLPVETSQNSTSPGASPRRLPPTTMSLPSLDTASV